MKNLITLFALHLIVIFSVQAQQPAPKGFYHLNGDLLSVKTTGSSVFITGTNGIFLHSADKGETWAQTIMPTSDALREVDFFDIGSGICVGDNATILRTQDSGKTWQKVTVEYSGNITGISIQGNNAFAAGTDGVLHSADQGVTWQRIEGEFTGAVFSGIRHITDNTIVASTINGRIYTSTDGGKTWKFTALSTADFPVVSRLKISGNNMISIVYSSDQFPAAKLFTSRDNGATWQENLVLKKIGGVAFYNDKGIILGNEGSYTGLNPFLLTADDGQTFTDATSLDSTYFAGYGFLNDVEYIDDANAIAIGSKKTIYKTTNAGQDWNLVSYCYGNTFRSVYSINDNIYVGGINEKVYRSNNKGATWLPFRSQLNKFGDYRVYKEYITTLSFINDTTAFALSSRGVDCLLKTTNAWKNFDYSENFYKTGFLSKGAGLKFFDEMNGVILGQILQKTTDGGLTWEKKQVVFGDTIQTISTAEAIDNKIFLMSAIIRDTSKRYGHSNYSMIYRSEDGGDTWTSIIMPGANTLGNFCFISKDTGFVAGAKYTPGEGWESRMFQTTDGGKTWKLVDSGIKSIFSVTSFSGNRLYNVGQEGIIRYSDDRGKTWATIPNGEVTYDFFASFADKNNAYFVGGEDVILKSLPSQGTTSVGEPVLTGNAGINDIYMKEVYPNPTSGAITLKLYYSLAMNRNDIKVSVYSMTGERVADITDSFRQTIGNNPALVRWDTGTIPAGIYIIEAKGGNASMTVPVVITR